MIQRRHLYLRVISGYTITDMVGNNFLVLFFPFFQYWAQFEDRNCGGPTSIRYAFTTPAQSLFVD